MNKSTSFPSFIAMFMFVVTIFSPCGCKKENTPGTIADLKVVPREPAYAGCYPVIGTSQTRCWDSAGNIIIPGFGSAFYGQDAQFTHTMPVYTKSSDGLTVKDEVTGLTWQKNYDSGIYF